MIVGLIADTHGILLPAALEKLKGSEMILHAGDVGPLSILRRLEELAPVRAVFGNTDNEELRRQCPEELVVDAGKVRIAVVHGDAWPPARRLDEMASRYGAVGVKAVIYGHTHVADVTRRKGVLLVNPGSAGKRNFGHALSVARMTVTGEDVSVEILPIEPAVEEP